MANLAKRGQLRVDIPGGSSRCTLILGVKQGLERRHFTRKAQAGRNLAKEFR